MEYKTIIGLEIHVQLKTQSKMFCGCNNKAEEAKPNTLVCPVCLGLPGVLPVANRQAIEWTLKTGLALNSKIAEKSKFDRKHYFYPDLPKNYQISQFDLPFCTGGYLEIRNKKEEIRKINLTRIHLEEDAGKLIHTENATLVDLNRAGTPLMEIVTNPEISSPQEAKIFMQELRTILRFLSVSDANMESGHLRCDANISVAEIRNEKWEIGIPVEIKNMNSFKMVERALAYEEKRQRQLLEKGEKIVKETRGWNDGKGETYSQRSKEYAQDYRYFPEPDIPPFETVEFNLAKIKEEMPELPAEKRKRYIDDLGLAPQDAAVLTLDKQMAEYFEEVATKVSPKLAANWVINELPNHKPHLSGEGGQIKSGNLIELLQLIEKGEISGKIAKNVLAEMVTNGKNASEIIKEKGLGQVSNESEIIKIIDEVSKENQKSVEDFKKGKKEALGFLVGQVMKKTQGKANPQIVNKLLNERIK
ncbi:MAG: Asp-tRNA(Asn)/Glu-tRNA(Gln) amidotransferase subunit GatB [Patescibacteria group bacterium]|nr:Asp-tRNA(Asn)/Glu-tRNA(Gln) amidotransferase subunit GatB [Patescibacteria group bacterium]